MEGYIHNDADYKKNAIQAAKELKYPPSVIQKIERAESDAEITRILKNARLKEWGTIR